MTEALEGLRVVDLTSTLPGAFASQLFSDFGAEVVVVEPPGGNPLRWQPAAPFWFRGKKSIELDLKDEGDVAVARSLAPQPTWSSNHGVRGSPNASGSAMTSSRR